MRIVHVKWTVFFFSCFAVLNIFAYESPSEDEPVPVKIATDVRVEGAYINVPVPGSQSTAAFFTLRNLSDQPLTLIAVHTEIAKRAELHSHTHKNGMIQMRREKHLVIPAKTSLEFTSGSYHVMLFDLQRSIQTGEQLQLLLEFSDGKQLPATADVKSLFDRKHHH